MLMHLDVHSLHTKLPFPSLTVSEEVLLDTPLAPIILARLVDAHCTWILLLRLSKQGHQ